MHFLSIWTFGPDHAKAAIERFLSEGADPPEGVTLVSRWHDAAGCRGFTVAAADDASAIAEWSLKWHDLISFEIIPVITDSELRTILD